MDVRNASSTKPLRRQLVETVPVLAALVPFAAAVVAHSTEPAPNSTASGQETEQPALAFDQYLVNLGKVPPGEQFVQARYRFTNTGQRRVRITGLDSSCGCLQPRLAGGKSTYQPGESGEFLVRVETPNEEPGPQEYFIDVRYVDPKPRETKLTFKVELPEPQVVIRPKALFFWQLSGTPSRGEVYVADNRPNPLRVLRVHSSSPLVTARIDQEYRGEGGSSGSGDPYDDGGKNRGAPVDRTEPRRHRTRIVVNVQGDVPPGRHTALVRIETDDPEYSNLHFPLRITGPERGAVQPASASNVEGSPEGQHVTPAAR